jgi:hypothetical protein
MFQGQVLIQCKFFLLSFDELISQITSGMYDRDQKHAIKAWCVIQSMLTCAANISKALWGQADRLANERKPLRDSIVITDLPALHSVLMRNNFDHFDERIDQWWKQTTDCNVVDLIIAATNPGSGFKDIDIWRNFNHATGEVIFWSQRFDLYAVRGEIEQIIPVLEKECSKHHWEP